MDYIDTFSGRKIYVLNPDPNEIVIEDIAHALSLITRFGGHTTRFYSVAQHSIYVSQICESRDALWGLLHDATEAYIGDIPKPIKALHEMESFKKAEDNLQKVIMQKFQLDTGRPPNVKTADIRMLMAEKLQLMTNSDLKLDKFPGISPAEIKIEDLSSSTVEQSFLKRFYELSQN